MTRADALVARSEQYRSQEHLTFGGELRASYLLEGQPFSQYRRVGARNIRRFLLRPSSEGIIFSFWDRFQSGVVDPPTLINITSLLCGRIVGATRGPGRTKPDANGHFFEFKRTPDAIEEICALLNTQANCPEAGLNLAIAAFAAINLAHVLDDGNGRLARMAIQAIMARHGLVAPFLPLGPVLYNHAAAVTRGLAQLGQGLPGSDLTAVLSECFEDALQLSIFSCPLPESPSLDRLII